MILIRRLPSKRFMVSAIVVLIALAVSMELVQAQQTWPLWDAYSQRFIDGQGRVIDRSAGDRTTSEGQAYAMFFALVANDHEHFEKLVNWTEANLAGGDLTLRLPAWEWGKVSDSEWKVIDDNPASDADLWMAYSLMEAGRLWHETRYAKLGQIMASRIAQQEVVLAPGVGTTLIPGPHGFHPDPETWLLNPSYLPIPVLTYLAKTNPQGPWGAVLGSLPVLLNQGAGNGFAMDWVTASNGGIHPAAAPAQATDGKKNPQVVGSYDAIRVYLWLGIADPAMPGVKDLLRRMSGMTDYLRTVVTPPLEVDASGKVLTADAPPGFSAAVAPFLLANGMKAQALAQLDRLAATRDAGSGLYGRSVDYYDQDLALFSTGFVEQRYRFERDGKLRLKWK